MMLKQERMYCGILGTEEAGVSRLVERAFSCPRSMNGETEGGGELRGDNVLV